MPLSHNFELIQAADIPEINSHARLFHHLPSGAQLLSLENSDENKVFSVNFRTPPLVSDGVAHIMEHSVLCGSQKYPVKEPFVELAKGSLNTFLNAFTYPDKTCYPVASQNLQDFYNLIDVYVDAVFHPLLAPLTLDQEGWHYELDDLDAPLVYKGVVFNEMKGAYSSPDSLLGRYTQRSLFPDTPYSVDSGGDPAVIPDLTYAQFKAFHETCYHPGNALIYFYGDDDPQERLRRMDASLADFGAGSTTASIPLQAPSSAPSRHVYPYESGESSQSQKGMLVVNWLFPEILDQELDLGLGILNYILIGTPAAPLRKALIDSGLGEDIAGGGLENDLRQMYFSIGMKGVEPQQANFDQVETLVLHTLQQLAADGIDPGATAAALNTVEFRLRENNTGSFPRGLLLMLRSLSTWLYGGDPFSPLAFEAPLQAIKNRLAAGEPYFENLIRQLILNNSHRTTVILQPQAGLNDQQEQAEQDKLAAVRAGLDSTALQAILENTRRLKQHQETPDSPQALATIPGLELADLERQNKLIPLAVGQVGETPLLVHDLFTNGIIYLDLGLNLHALPLDLLPYTALFGRALLEMGAKNQDFVQLSQRIGQTTGGIRPSFFVTTRFDSSQTAAWLFLRGKATLEHGADLLSILDDVLRAPRLDNPERFRQIVLEEKADLESALTPAGHRLVNTRLHSFFSQAGWIDEQLGGVNHLYFLRHLVDEIDRDWPSVLGKLERIRACLVNRRNLIANLTLDQAAWGAFDPHLQAFLHALPDEPLPQPSWEFQPVPHDQGLSIPSQVNFVGLGANLYSLGYTLHGSQAVINNYLRATWLWEKVRVQGGAYGGFCMFDHRSGVFTFLSYRDPNLVETLDIYNQTGQFLQQLDGSRLSPAELTKTIIGAIGDLDAYQLPDAKGFTSMARFLAGESDEIHQRRRAEILAASLDDFHRFGAVLEAAAQVGRVVVIGSEQDLQAAIAHGRSLDLEKVL